MSPKHLISIIGPTAVGKTSLAIAISRHFKAPILSADSRQFYKEMTIGTAVPTPAELATAPHHFIQHKSIHESYNVGDFEKEAISFLTDHFQKHDIAILVGGSGLYTDAVCHGLDHFPNVKSEIRNQLNEQYQSLGLKSLQEELAQVDPHSLKTLDLNNPVRVIRALEVYRASGKPFSSFQNRSRPSRPFKVHTIGIEVERDVLYERINKRVDLMVEMGLEEEALSLLPFKNLNALNTVGYKELFSFFEGQISLAEAIEDIKKNSRRFAKRQGTWNRKKSDVFWVPYTEAKEKSLHYLEASLP